MTTTNTADITFYTLTAPFAGYTLLDSILGPQSASEWAANATGTEDYEAAQLADWIDSTGAFYTSREAAATAFEEAESTIRNSGDIEAFTPREIVRRLRAEAAQDQE